MVKHFLLLAFLAANAAAAENDAAARVAAIEARIGARIGVAALDTSNGKRLDHRAEERFPMCSTFKFLAAAAVLKRVDEKQEKLDRFVSYVPEYILEDATFTNDRRKDARKNFGASCEAVI